MTVYTPPNGKEEAEEVLRNLQWMIYRLFIKDPTANLIITGDFNKHHLNQQVMKKYNIKALIPPGTATDNEGNLLD